jgi:hypothetical protein
MSELDDVCDKLLAEAGARKVMVCSAEGEMLAHAGALGALDEPTTDAIAKLVTDVLKAPATSDTTNDAPSRAGTLFACAASVAGQAALVVLFEERASPERVRAKMRRARDLLEKSLPGESKRNESGNPIS